VWDPLLEASSLEFATITNSNMHTSCAYEILRSGELIGMVVYVSTVIPAMTIFDSRTKAAVAEDVLDADLRQAVEGLKVIGFRYIEDRLCRTLSPYIDPDFGYPLVYFEMLFEWFQGEEMFGPDERLSPWV